MLDFWLSTILWKRCLFVESNQHFSIPAGEENIDREKLFESVKTLIKSGYKIFDEYQNIRVFKNVSSFGQNAIYLKAFFTGILILNTS